MRQPIIALLPALAFAAGSCSDALPPGGSGAVIWSVPGSSAGTAAADGSRVYFIGEHNQVIAVDKRTGARRWTAPTGGGGGFTRGHQVLLAGGLAIAADLDLVAFDAATGAGRWAFRPEPNEMTGVHDFDTDGTLIYTGSTSGHVYAVDLQGKAAWTRNLRDSVDAAAYGVVLHEGMLYVCFRRFAQPSTGGIVALHSASGAIAWRIEFPPTPPNNSAGCLGSVVIADDLVVGATQDGNIHAYDRRTGTHAWSAPQVGGLTEPFVGNPLMDSRFLAAGAGVVVAGSSTTWVVGHDARTGKELWRASSRRGSVFYPIAADHEAAYVTGSGDELSSYDLRTGTLRWRIVTHHDDPFAPRPLIDGDRIYIGTNAALMALRR